MLFSISIISASYTVLHIDLTINMRISVLFVDFQKCRLKGRIVQPPKTGLKCTSAAALTLQQTVACTILPFKHTFVL